MARRSRASETRQVEQRPEIEANHTGALYFPKHQWPKGMGCRWVRVGVRESPDPDNWAKAYRTGWVPMKLSEAPQFAIPNMDGTIPVEGIVRLANHILCKKPMSDVERDREAQRQRTREQSQLLDEYVRDNTEASVPRFNRSGPTMQTGPVQAFKE